MCVPFGGRCQCGALTYECSAPPIFMVNCHCSACQKISGAAYVSALRVPSAALQVRGEVRKTARQGDSGHVVEDGFCAECGSRMFSFAASLEGSVGLFATSLDDQSWYRPQFNIYVSRAPHWHNVDRTLPSFDTVPSSQDVQELMLREQIDAPPSIADGIETAHPDVPGHRALGANFRPPRR